MNSETNISTGTETNPQDLAKHWRHQIDRWQHSGQSQGRFCKANDLVYHQFLYWRHKLTKPKTKPSNQSTLSLGFAAVAVQHGFVIVHA
jgi:hypothetical protein